jgi:serine/threonine protein kinase
MGNILVNSIGPTFKFYDVQLIDWNLASFYYTGYDSDMKRGTVCYYSPEQLFNTFHITPAIDVWALGVVMFTFYTDSKPFSFNCKSDNLRAIVSLVGGNKILDLYKKYRYNSIGNLNLLDDIEQNPGNFPEKDYTAIQIKSNKEFYKKDLIEVFKRMLEPDPELRATPEELMSMDYFKKIKKLPEIYSMKNIKKKKTNSQESQKPV